MSANQPTDVFVRLVAMPTPEEVDTARTAFAQIEQASHGYDISGLQSFRASNLGLKRVTKSIFGPHGQSEGWAMHSGGRSELQFNAALDFLPGNRRSLRAGVAFSFRPSRSLPDAEVLAPKVARFNDYLRQYPEAFADLSMWHWQEKRSDDYYPSAISPARIYEQAFVFLGINLPISEFDPHAALTIFDRLFPLYKWVETNEQHFNIRPATVLPDQLQLDNGVHIDGGRWIKATTCQRTLDIYLRHREMQRMLKLALHAEGFSDVYLEARLGARAIDLVAKHGDELWFYEVKTASEARLCIREALGQLLEYALWPGATRPARLIVVGTPTLDDAAKAYLASLNQTVSIPIAYRQQPLEN